MFPSKETRQKGSLQSSIVRVKWIEMRSIGILYIIEQLLKAQISCVRKDAPLCTDADDIALPEKTIVNEMVECLSVLDRMSLGLF